MDFIDIAHQAEFYTLITNISIILPLFLVQLISQVRQKKKVDKLFIIIMILYPVTFGLKLSRNLYIDPKKFEQELSLGTRCLGITVSVVQNFTNLTVAYYIFCV